MKKANWDTITISLIKDNKNIGAITASKYELDMLAKMHKQKDSDIIDLLIKTLEDEIENRAKEQTKTNTSIN